MNPDYRKIIEGSRSRRKEIKSFLEKLKANPPRNLDVMTNELHDEVFEKIDCLQCANCCTSTGPLLKNRDIDQLASAVKMRPADFTQKYLRIDEDNDYVFQSMPCPFLRTDHYCSVYESRPAACREYPHTQQRDIRGKLSITYHNTMICPAVSLIVDELMKKGK